jgi:hypothetical protein
MNLSEEKFGTTKAESKKRLDAAVQQENLMQRLINWLRRTRGTHRTSSSNRFRPALDALGETSPVAARRLAPVNLEVEHLEQRVVPTGVSFHYGPVISHVQLETVYWGQDWTQQANQTTQQNLDTFAQNIAQSSYMSMLGEYGVGQGNWVRNDIVTNSASPAYGATVTDAQIQGMLAHEIGHLGSRNLTESTGQQVYVVYLPPGVHSQHDEADLQTLAHHDSFNMWYKHYSFYRQWWSYDTVPYIVVPDPGTDPIWQTHTSDYNGAGDIAGGWTNFQKLTEVTTHELAETVTDPVLGTGWCGNDAYGNADASQEIGDLSNLHWTTLNGYYVQKEWSNYFNGDNAPAFETYGGLAGPYNGGWYTSYNGQTGFYAMDTYGNLYLDWQLADGSWTGFYAVTPF